MFWIAYAFVNFIDEFDGILDYIPYYIVCKLLFILFLMFGGSWLLFTVLIDPFIRNMDKKNKWSFERLEVAETVDKQMIGRHAEGIIYPSLSATHMTLLNIFVYHADYDL